MQSLPTDVKRQNVLSSFQRQISAIVKPVMNTGSGDEEDQEGPPKFHFVNETPDETAAAPSSTTSSGARRVATRDARSFVMRRARQNQTWSTRSTRTEDRRRTRQQQRSDVAAAAAAQAQAEFAGGGGGPALAPAAPLAASGLQTLPASNLGVLRSVPAGLAGPGAELIQGAAGPLPYIVWNDIPLCLICNRPRVDSGLAEDGICRCETAMGTEPPSASPQRLAGTVGGGGEWVVDPFDSLAMPLTGADADLLSYCKFTYSWQFFVPVVKSLNKVQRTCQRLVFPQTSGRQSENRRSSRSIPVVTNARPVVDSITPQLTTIANRIPPELIREHWVNPATTHTAFMHALLCVTALHRCLASPNDNDYNEAGRRRYVAVCLSHRVQAIAAVQANLSDPVRAISDENIAAVFNLVCVEGNLLTSAFDAIGDVQLRPDLQQRTVHLNGLRQMVVMRGGLGNLRRIRGLQSFIIR
jgi:hypothetical protein